MSEARHRDSAVLAHVRTPGVGHAYPPAAALLRDRTHRGGRRRPYRCGRLGHGGGGTTTLRVYSAWVAEADQRAASSLAARMPVLPATATGNGTSALPVATDTEDSGDSPYRRIAADLRAAIRCGALGVGEHLPTVKILAERYSVSEGTAHRAMALLAEGGEVAVSRGKRAVIVERRTMGAP